MLTELHFNDSLIICLKKNGSYTLKKVLETEKASLQYLARYTHRIAISNHRIISLNNDIVTFKYRDYKDDNKEKFMDLDAFYFIQRFMTHIVPKRFVRIRYFGLLAHRNKKKTIEACREFYHIAEKTETANLKWHEMYMKVTGKKISSYPACKNGTLMLKEYPGKFLQTAAG